MTAEDEETRNQGTVVKSRSGTPGKPPVPGIEWGTPRQAKVAHQPKGRREARRQSGTAQSSTHFTSPARRATMVHRVERHRQGRHGLIE